MDFFFEPNGVAVIGATPEPYSGGRFLIANLTLGYQGPIYPVNPKYDEILGLKCYSRVSDIPGPLDLALIFVPADVVPQVLEDCVAKGVRGAILESSGFAEVGPEGKGLQDHCLAIAQKGGMRLWGPNCMGLIDTSKRYVFSFITPEAWQEVINPGGVSLIVQSGLLSAGFVTTLMGDKTLGLAKVCSIGNRSDVEETELLEYLLRDPATNVIALYLESFIHGRRFFELALSSEKPIVVLKGGKTPLGAEASASHTASLAGNNELVRGVLRQAGVHQADDFFEMVDIARTLEKDFRLQQPPEGKARIAILSYSGAAGIVTTDHLVANGLTLAQLSPKTLKRLEELSPPWMPVRNPVDYWPAAEKHGLVLAYKHGIETLHDAPEVDGMIIHLFAGFGIWFLDMKEIMPGIKRPRKPILFWLIGPEKGREPTRMTLEGEGWPTFHEIHRTVKVMASLFEESKKRNKHSAPPSVGQNGPRPAYGGIGGVKGHNIKRHYIAEKPRPLAEEFHLSIPHPLRKWVRQIDDQGTKILDEHEAKKWLESLDLNVVKEVVVKEADEAIRAAEKMGYPVVLKGRVEGKIHKTEAGLVKLNLWSSNQIRSAYHEMLSIKPKPQSFLIQPMLKGDLELIVGITRDPQFGPAVMLGLGGIHAEVYRDVVFRLPPLNPNDLFEMVSELKGQALLKGYRGSKPVDMKSLADWLIKLGWLAMNFEKIQQVDVNPLLIVDGEPVAVDATIIFG
jgi:acyl-CoA synthetase (NDP forming)